MAVSLLRRSINAIFQNALLGQEPLPESPLLPESPPNVDPLVEELWPFLGPEFSVSNLRTWSEDTLRARMTSDALLDNLMLNKWEFANGRTVLESYPWRLSIPFILCNAKCDFCAAWHVKGNAPLDDLMTSLLPVIQRAVQLDLVGWGEPLVHPQFADILNLLKKEAHPRARIALTTNGTRLDAWSERLLEANVMDYAISVHATNSKTHQDLMGFEPHVFDTVIDAVSKLAARKSQFPNLFVELVLVVTQQNIGEIPAFIALSESLGVHQVHLRTLMPLEAPRDGLDYHRLPPYLHPEFEHLRDAAVAAMSNASVRVKGDPQTWSRPVFSPEWEAKLADIPTTSRQSRTKSTMRIGPIDWDKLGAGETTLEPAPLAAGENTYGREAPLYCPSPYTAFYVNGTDRRVIPCVYMHKVPGHEFIHFKPSMSFKDVWNSPATVAVRRHLHRGPLMPACLTCPFHC